ncbi:MAG: 2-iminoacetate synthase ThiH [Candidatus Omnitrophica bacterium]|nr:2-iminoacetate synthase ThiH [Candidatus Omnitrophota bacterium]
MSYHDILKEYSQFDLESAFTAADESGLCGALGGERVGEKGLIALLSPYAAAHLERIAQKAHRITLKHFGRTIQLYTPIYVSNYCQNRCLYCGFNSSSDIPRKKLTLIQVEKEASFISSTGLRHVLLLTGGSRKESPVSYIIDCLRVLRRYFSSISVEIYSLEEEEYALLIKEGVDGLTIYQETYQEDIYRKVHPSGPKRDYRFRLDAPERALRKGMRAVNIGALLGLAPWRRDVFLMALHARYLCEKFPEAEVGVSLPRLRPTAGGFRAAHPVSDRDIAQVVMAMRLFLPRQGITISTREEPSFRENLMPLGVTRISAGSTTSVGGHTQSKGEDIMDMQFRISDERDVAQIREMLRAKGYQAVLQDWMTV